MLKYRKKIYIFSGFLLLLSIASIAVWGLKFSIDFTGGSLMEVKYLENRPTINETRGVLNKTIQGNFNIQPFSNDSFIIKFGNINEKEHFEILSSLKTIGKLEENRFATIGPIIGKELKEKSFWAILSAVVAMIFFIAWSFRKISKQTQISSFKYGGAAIIALVHDILIVLGVFSILGKFYNIEIDISFTAAILTILGYSVNDTIIVFDKIRDNIISKKFDSFLNLAETSVKGTLTRSLYTSLTTLFVLTAILVFGGATIKFFVVALIIGIAFGTYSSIFIASAILIDWKKSYHP